MSKKDLSTTQKDALNYLEENQTLRVHTSEKNVIRTYLSLVRKGLVRMSQSPDGWRTFEIEPKPTIEDEQELADSVNRMFDEELESESSGPVNLPEYRWIPHNGTSPTADDKADAKTKAKAKANRQAAKIASAIMESKANDEAGDNDETDDEAEAEAEADEITADKKASVISSEYKARCVKAKTAEGKATVNCGDILAEAFVGMTLQQIAEICAREITQIVMKEGKPEKSVSAKVLLGRYDHLNPGMQRMNMVNILRAGMRRTGYIPDLRLYP